MGNDLGVGRLEGQLLWGMTWGLRGWRVSYYSDTIYIKASYNFACFSP